MSRPEGSLYLVSDSSGQPVPVSGLGPDDEDAEANETGGGSPPGGGGLEKRIEKLESAIPDIRERLIRLELKADSIDKHSASKADLAGLEATLIKWFVATAFAMTALASGIAFGIARMLAH